VGLCVGATPAMAKGKTVALVVEGPDADAVRNAIVAAVPQGTPIADAATFKGALTEQGVKSPFGKALDGAARDKTVARVRKAAAAAGVEGTLIAQVTRTHRERHVRLLLVATSGAAGDLEDEIVLGVKASKDDQDKIASSVGTALVDYRPSPNDREKAATTAKANPPEEATPSGGDEPEHAAASAPSTEGQPAADTGSAWARPHGVSGHDLFEVNIGAGGLGRHFGYSVDSSSSLNLRPYSVFPAAFVAVQAELYPLADSQSHFLRDIGLIGSYSRSLFLQSTVDGGTVDSTASAFLVGLRWRTMPGGDDGIQLGLSLSYAGQSFAYGSYGPTTPTDLPSVSYQAIRPAADLRIPLGRLAILAQAGFRGVLSAGDVALRFRGTTTTGFDVGAGVSFTVATGWEVRALGDYEGYFYSFGPAEYNQSTMSGDAFRAQSASDHNYGGRIAIAFVF
jgi:hypothetical protein